MKCYLHQHMKNMQKNLQIEQKIAGISLQFGPATLVI